MYVCMCTYLHMCMLVRRYADSLPHGTAISPGSSRGFSHQTTPRRTNTNTTTTNNTKYRLRPPLGKRWHVICLAAPPHRSRGGGNGGQHPDDPRAARRSPPAAGRIQPAWKRERSKQNGEGPREQGKEGEHSPEKAPFSKVNVEPPPAIQPSEQTVD